MAVLRERIETRLGIDEAFAFVADFGNASAWDPGVATSERVNGSEPRVGSRYQLGVRMSGRVVPMEYEITRLERPGRVVLRGSGSGVDAIDDIAFEATPTGTRIEYVADIRLQGLMRLVAPFAGGAFRKIAENARNGMQRKLDELADARAGRAATTGPAGSEA